MRQEMRLNSGNLRDPGSQGQENGLDIELVPVDESFIKRYYNVALPELRAGDLILAALAKGDQIPLVTEDRELLVKSKSAGIAAFTITEFLQEHAGAAS